MFSPSLLSPTPWRSSCWPAVRPWRSSAGALGSGHGRSCAGGVEELARGCSARRQWRSPAGVLGAAAIEELRGSARQRPWWSSHGGRSARQWRSSRRGCTARRPPRATLPPATLARRSGGVAPTSTRDGPRCSKGRAAACAADARQTWSGWHSLGVHHDGNGKCEDTRETGGFR